MRTRTSTALRPLTRGRVLLATGTATAATAAVLLVPATQSGAVPPGGPNSQSNGASVSLDRSSVSRGGRIKVTGRNWKSKGSRSFSGKVVTIKLNDRDILAVVPIKNRRFSAWVRIPKQVRAGNYWLRFLAAKPSTSVKSKTFRVR
jgi:hypothetical protein